MLFKKKTKQGEYETRKEGNEEVMYFNFDKYSKIPSIEDDPIVMAKTIESLVQTPSATRIIFNQKKNYEYGYSQTKILKEVSQIYNHFTKQKNILLFTAMGPDITYQKDFITRQKAMQYIILNLLRTDPVGAYVETTRLIRNEKIKLAKAKDEKDIISIKHYLNLLTDIFGLLNNTTLIRISKEYLPGYIIGNRDIYKKLFRPSITPDFMFTKLMSDPPLDGEEIDSYAIDPKTNIMVFKTPRDIKPLYHLIPPEFQISEDKYALIDLARNVLSEHQPKAEEFLDPERMRSTFLNIGRDLLTELASHKGIKLSYTELEDMAEILVRYTVGFGLLEVLLKDTKIQDIVINGPIGQTPIFVVHSDHEECVTNIIPSQEDGEGWASKLRLISARPLDEANPVLDTELILPGVRARVAAISSPLNPFGLAYAIRRHRDKPWTLPLFVQNRMITPLAAGLMSFLIDGARTLFIAGTRSSGKTSFLGSTLVEIMRKYRIISVEDSVTEDSEIIIKRNNKFEKTKIGSLINSLIENYGCWYNLSEHEILGNQENIEILSMNKEGKIELKKATKFIRHKVKKPVYQITTNTNKKIKVTGDHSLFNIVNGKIISIKVNELKQNDQILTTDINAENLTNKIAIYESSEQIELIENLTAKGDKIKNIELIKDFNDYVYDISVPENESFVCNNIIAHNTLELPTEALRELGYNIQPMKVRSALVKAGAEVSADEGIRTSLRLGDSSLIVGEIRSTEAFALFEAMRVGALANTVAGTIHGDSPYGVFDRVVNDLQVPRTSFKATDVIVICNPIKSPDGLHKFRRVTQITEVRKEWENDPLAEGGFVDLMRYDTKKDELVPTDNLINGDSYIIKSIAGNVKEWAGNWNAVWDNIMLRSKMKETLVKYAEIIKNNNLLEAKSTIAMNDIFHKITDEVREKLGYLDNKKIFMQWEQELKKYIKKNFT